MKSFFVTLFLFCSLLTVKADGHPILHIKFTMEMITGEIIHGYLDSYAYCNEYYNIDDFLDQDSLIIEDYYPSCLIKLFNTPDQNLIIFYLISRDWNIKGNELRYSKDCISTLDR